MLYSIVRNLKGVATLVCFLSFIHFSQTLYHHVCALVHPFEGIFLWTNSTPKELLLGTGDLLVPHRLHDTAGNMRETSRAGNWTRAQTGGCQGREEFISPKFCQTDRGLNLI